MNGTSENKDSHPVNVKLQALGVGRVEGLKRGQKQETLKGSGVARLFGTLRK